MATTRIATQPRVPRSRKSAQIPNAVDPNDPTLAKARAFAETIRQLEFGRTLKNPVKLPVFNKEGTDFLPDAFPVRPNRAKSPEGRKSSRPQSGAASTPDLARHRRKCAVCNHPDREEIEEQFIHWRRPGDIAYDFDIEETRYIHRHAHAVGLYTRRRENYLFTLENLLERGDEIELTASAYIKAVRAYACMCDTVRWTEPAIRVAHEYNAHSASPPLGLSTRRVDPACPERSRRDLARRGGPVEGRDSSPSAWQDSNLSSGGTPPSSLLPQAALEDSARSAPPRAEGASPGGAPCGSGLQPRRNTRLGHVSTSERLEGRGSSSTSPRASSRSCALEEKSVPAPSSLLPRAASEDSAPSALQSSSDESPKVDNEPKITGHVPLPASSFEPLVSSPNRPSPRLEMGVSDRKQRKEAISNRP